MFVYNSQKKFKGLNLIHYRGDSKGSKQESKQRKTV